MADDIELQRYIWLLDGKSNPATQQSGRGTGESLSSAMLVTLISSLAIALVLVGLAVSRFYARRQKQAGDSSYSVTRYRRRPLASTSFDSFAPSPTLNCKPTTQVVNETTHIIKNSFSWPDTSAMHRHEEEPGKSPSSLSSSSTLEHISEQPSLTFGLRWNDTNNSLFVRVVSARDLFIQRRNRQPALIDSYVRVELLSTSKSSDGQGTVPSMRTHIIKKNAFPVYDELFEFNNLLLDNHETHSLLFTVSTYDTFTRDEVLGEVNFPLQLTVLSSTEMTFTQSLTARQQQLYQQQLGQMLLSLCYQPADSSLTLVVLKASNLPRIATARAINPYFKVYMFYKNQRIVKKRSTIKRATQSPVYNECFTFNIPNNEIDGIHLDIILFDYDRHMKHEPIGMFSIGKEVSQHWNDVCERQSTKQVAHWYQLKAFNGGAGAH